MHLIYFDEVKDDQDTQKYYWVGGIALESSLVKEVEKKVSDISELHFSTPCIGHDTEFHAAEIYHRKRLFKEWNDPSVRIGLIGALLKILDDERIKKIYVKIDKAHFNSKFSAKKIDEMAFMLFCEKANGLMGRLKDVGMIIGDRENTSLASRYAERLSNWRNFGTDYSLGRRIDHLIDTVHFTESHLSRLLQLADVHIWCRQFRSLNRDSTNDFAKLMLKEIEAAGNALFAHTYKEYPLGC